MATWTRVSAESTEKDRILDCVCAILEERDKPLLAAELVLELAQRGLQLSKPALNDILYAPEQRRDGLEHDANFRWTYVRPPATPAQGPDLQSLVRMFEGLGLTFEGVRRRIGGPLFLVVDESEAGYRIVGPKGLVLHEAAELFGDREECGLLHFSFAQVEAAMRLRFEELFSSTKKNAATLLQSMLRTEFHYQDVYHGPLCERVEDVIPVTASIATAFVSDVHEICRGPGATINPLFLVIDVQSGVLSDSRYGVFKLGIYDLMKKGYIHVREDEIVVRLRASADGVYLDGPTAILKLE